MGMGTDGGTSLLETPPFVISVVFCFFLLVTLGFEWVRHTQHPFTPQCCACREICMGKPTPMKADTMADDRCRSSNVSWLP